MRAFVSTTYIWIFVNYVKQHIAKDDDTSSIYNTINLFERTIFAAWHRRHRLEWRWAKGWLFYNYIVYKNKTYVSCRKFINSSVCRNIYVFTSSMNLSKIINFSWANLFIKNWTRSLLKLTGTMKWDSRFVKMQSHFIIV